MITRRDMMKGTAAFAGGLAFPGTLEVGLAPVAQGSSGGPAKRVEKDDLALVNGKFVDGRGNSTTALTIKNGRITSIGSAEKPAADVTLVDLRGRLIGVTCRVSTKYAATYGQNSGVGFVVTWDKIDELLPALQRGERLTEKDHLQPFLGVQAKQDSSAEGAEVEKVLDDSAAAKAGIKDGDVIIAFDDVSVESFEELRVEILRHKPGDKVKVTLRRGEEEMDVELTLGGRPSDE